jgi:hypothetical protein
VAGLNEPLWARASAAKLLRTARVRADTKVISAFAVAGLEQAAWRRKRQSGLVIGAIDETGQEKAGHRRRQAPIPGMRDEYVAADARAARHLQAPGLVDRLDDPRQHQLLEDLVPPPPPGPAPGKHAPEHPACATR